jgi:hypothetical protein
MSLRVPAFELADLDPRQRSLLKEWLFDRSQAAPPSQVWRVLLTSPDGFRVFGKTGAFVRMGTVLPPELRVVASFAASTQRAYAFEIETQRRNLKRIGWTESDIAALARRELASFDDNVAIAATLAFAVADRTLVADDLLSSARERLGDQAVVELVIVSAYFCMLADIALVLVG